MVSSQSYSSNGSYVIEILIVGMSIIVDNQLLSLIVNIKNYDSCKIL